MTLLDPEIQRYMRQQRLQSYLANAARGVLQAGMSGMGVGPGLLMGLANAGAAGAETGPLDMLKLQSQLADLEDRKLLREREREQRFAQDALIAGDRYDPKSGILWNQPPTPDRKPRPPSAFEAERLLSKAHPAAYGKAKMAELFPAPTEYLAPEMVEGPGGKPMLVRFPKGRAGAPIPVKGYSPREKPEAGGYGEVQTDELGRQYQLGPRGKRHYLPGQGSDALPSVSRDFVLPLLRKVQSGQPLTPDEQQAWDMYSRTGLIDQMLRGMQGVSPTVAPNRLNSAPPASGGGTNESQLLSQAREAIAAGESRAAVAAELRAMGVDPGRL